MARSWRTRSGWLATAVLFVVAVTLVAWTPPAYAYKETSGTPYPVPLGHSGYSPGEDYEQCLSCHGYSDASGDCYDCHNEIGFWR